MPNLTITYRARVRKDVSDVLLQNYWDSIGEALSTINSAMKLHKMFLDTDDIRFKGDEGRTTIRILAEPGYKYICTSCTKDGVFDNVLSFRWHRVPFGWKINAYIS